MRRKMILTTSSQLEGYQITEYLDVVFGEAIVGANIFRDLLASVRDIVGGAGAGPTRPSCAKPARLPWTSSSRPLWPAGPMR